jgi:elongation factor P
MASTADFRNGLCIEFNNDLYTIIEFQHVKPGKGPAFVRTKMRNLKNGKIIDNTFNAGVKVNTARIETRPHQFLYKDDFGFTFMDMSSYEQVTLDPHMISDEDFLQDGLEVAIVFHAETETALSCEMPKNIIAEIIYSEPGIKGDTATNATKPATLSTGAIVQVPLFIETGELIKVDVEKRCYVERAKKA